MTETCDLCRTFILTLASHSKAAMSSSTGLLKYPRLFLMLVIKHFNSYFTKINNSTNYIRQCWGTVMLASLQRWGNVVTTTGNTVFKTFLPVNAQSDTPSKNLKTQLVGLGWTFGPLRCFMYLWVRGILRSTTAATTQHEEVFIKCLLMKEVTSRM